MRRKPFGAGCALATVTVLLAGDALAADLPVFCGTQPWQAIVREAAERFDLPRAWLDAVMSAESAGCAIVNGKPTTSTAGAMGLMQLMPSTWLQYRARLRLGDDPFDAHDNIIAGAAYLHDLYRRYGEDGFLAAYQAGPERYEEFLRDGRPLPRATIEYIARVQGVIQQGDPRSFTAPLSIGPAASSIFVILTTKRSSAGAAPNQQFDTRLFVPLSPNPRTAQSSGR
ncbi:MAG: lytic transglycosylase domain-containing protein [Steroidobacteraceae bacterium]